MAPAMLVQRPVLPDQGRPPLGRHRHGRHRPVDRGTQPGRCRCRHGIHRTHQPKAKLDRGYSTRLSADLVIKDLVRCGYVKAADIADRFGDPTTLDPSLDPEIVGPAGIFSQTEFSNDSEFRKTASVMKMVVNGFAGAGTITMGGYDYHTGYGATGELRDLRAGRCIGACLEYAARANNGAGVPLMIYVFSDGSVFSNGMTDDTQNGGGKGVWTG